MLKEKVLNSEVERIKSILEKNDLKQIKTIGKYRGFIEKVTRIEAYILLMNINVTKMGERVSEHFNEPKFRKFEDVIMHDISRSFHHLSISKEQNTKQRMAKREEFKIFIYTQLGAHPQIQYYQGMNDIAELMFQCYGKTYGFAFLEYFLTKYFDVFTGNEFDICLNTQTSTIIEILKISKPQIASILDSHEKIGFLWPWLLTYFMHSLSNIDIINRILDFVICSPKYDIVLVCVAVVVELWDRNLARYYPDVSFDLITEVYYHRNLDALDWENIMKLAIKLDSNEEVRKLITEDNIEDTINKQNEVKLEEERINNLKQSPYSKMVESPGKQTWYDNLLGNFWTENNSTVDANKSYDNKDHKTNGDIEFGMVTPDKKQNNKVVDNTRYKGFVAGLFDNFKLFSNNQNYSKRNMSESENKPNSNKMVDKYGSPISHKSSILTQKELESTMADKQCNAVRPDF